MLERLVYCGGWSGVVGSASCLVLVEELEE